MPLAAAPCAAGVVEAGVAEPARAPARGALPRPRRRSSSCSCARWFPPLAPVLEGRSAADAALGTTPHCCGRRSAAGTRAPRLGGTPLRVSAGLSPDFPDREHRMALPAARRDVSSDRLHHVAHLRGPRSTRASAPPWGRIGPDPPVCRWVAWWASWLAAEVGCSQLRVSAGLAPASPARSLLRTTPDIRARRDHSAGDHGTAAARSVRRRAGAGQATSSTSGTRMSNETSSAGHRLREEVALVGVAAEPVQRRRAGRWSRRPRR